MTNQIEDFLEISKEEIDNRRRLIISTMPTRPGISYLEGRLKEFESQPWPFIIYLAHYHQSFLEETLISYASYDGNENVGVIKEKLKEYHVLSLLLLEAAKKLKDRSQSTPL